MNRVRIFHPGIILILSTVFLFGCVEKRTPDGDFYTLIISDTHISKDESKDRRLDELFTMINSNEIPDVHLVFNTGDAVSRIYGDYTETNRDTSDDRMQRYLDIIDNLDVPIYTVLGNHDYKIGSDVDSDDPFSREQIEQAERLWLRKGNVYPYYSIEYNGFKFIVLNSMRGRYRERHFDPAQINWLRAELVDKVPTILLFHHPLETDHFRLWCSFKDRITEEKEPEFYALCREHKNTIKSIFVGHGHRWNSDTLFETIQVYETESFGDEEDSPYYLVGLDTTNYSVDVVDSESLIFSTSD